jgi:hypothetical protein
MDLSTDESLMKKEKVYNARPTECAGFGAEAVGLGESSR